MNETENSKRAVETDFVGKDALEVGAPARPRTSGRRAFTLVELLIVISIIAILASLVFPITKAVNRSKLRSRAKAELAQMENAIESYKSKMGFYPPDAFGNLTQHQLYYELSGATIQGAGESQFYQALDGNTNAGGTLRASPAAFQNYFPTAPAGSPRNPQGKKVTGLMNAGAPGGGDEGRGAMNFLKGIKPQQVGLVKIGAETIRVLACTVPWPQNQPGQAFATAPTLNPWRYNSSSATNNPGSYELWVDIYVDGKTNRISNWSKEPLIVSQPD